MIWDQDVSVIVMLTTTMENGKVWCFNVVVDKIYPGCRALVANTKQAMREGIQFAQHECNSFMASRKNLFTL